MNCLLFPEKKEWQRVVRQDSIISQSEYAQMESRLDDFVQKAKTLELDLRSLRAKMQKPLRPVWVSRSLNLQSEEEVELIRQNEDCHPVLLCMASRYQESADETNSTYVQGAADDSESWAHGLTPDVFLVA